MKFHYHFWTLVVFSFLCGCTKEGSTKLKDVDDVCTTMEDLAFMQYCYDRFDTNHDGKVSMEEANAVSIIDVGARRISSLKGLEYFPNLTMLSCHSNNLTTLDVSIYQKLSVLSCGNNNLTSLSVSNNTLLTELDCSDNNLKRLDISHNGQLTRLNCNYNEIESLDVSNNGHLAILFCRSNSLTTLDVSNNSSLSSLACDNNQLSELDLSSNPRISTLIVNPQKGNKTIAITGLPTSFYPKPPTGLALFNVTSSSITTQWNAVEGVTSYLWKLYLNEAKLQEGYVNSRNVTISGLNGKTTYRFSIESVNSFGTSEPVWIDVQTK